MPIVKGATYVFDLGYYDYAWWAKLHGAGCRIVTRLKRNTPLAVSELRDVRPGGPILSDRIGKLPQRQANNRHNPFSDAVREVQVRIDTGKVLRIVTNDLSSPAEAIRSFTSADGPSNCSSAGSNRPCASASSSVALKMQFASRSPSP